MSSVSPSSRRSLLALALGVATGFAAWAWLRFASAPFLVAGGSDDALLLLEPAQGAQILACLLLGMAMAALLRRPSRATWLAALIVSAGFAMAGHRIALDGARARLSESYLLVEGSSIAFDPSEGLGERYRLEEEGLCAMLIPRGDAARHCIFLGLPPWRIDPAPLLRQVNDGA